MAPLDLLLQRIRREGAWFAREPSRVRIAEEEELRNVIKDGLKVLPTSVTQP
jgi:hypothetical protein